MGALLAGVVIGASIAVSLMQHLFNQGWIRSEWYDSYVTHIEKSAARGEFIVSRWL